MVKNSDFTLSTLLFCGPFYQMIIIHDPQACLMPLFSTPAACPSPGSGMTMGRVSKVGFFRKIGFFSD